MKAKRATAIAAVLVLACIAEARAAHPCDGGKLSKLLSYAASYDTEKLLAEPAVAAQIKRQLGKDAAKLQRNLGVVGPVELRGCDLVVEGNAQHQGGEEAAYFEVSLFSGEVAAGILSDGRVTIYTTQSRYAFLSSGVRDWAAVAATGFRYRMTPPPNAVLHTSGK